MYQKINLELHTSTYNDGEKIVSTFSCPLTKICDNKECFWWQCANIDRSPWFIHPQFEEEYKKQEKIREENPVWYFPKWHVSVGTACLHLVCEDSKFKETKS